MFYRSTLIACVSLAHAGTASSETQLKQVCQIAAQQLVDRSEDNSAIFAAINAHTQLAKVFKLAKPSDKQAQNQFAAATALEKRVTPTLSTAADQIQMDVKKLETLCLP